MRQKLVLFILCFSVIFSGIILVGCESPDTDPLAVTELELQEEYVVINKGERETLIARAYPFNANNKNLSWSSSDKFVATVTEGVVTANNIGQAQIYVETDNGEFVDMCYVDVI